MKFYDFTAKKMNGIEVKMDEYKGKVLLVVSCFNMHSGYIASSLKCYHFRTCEGGKPPFNPPFQRAERLIM